MTNSKIKATYWPMTYAAKKRGIYSRNDNKYEEFWSSVSNCSNNTKAFVIFNMLLKNNWL